MLTLMFIDVAGVASHLPVIEGNTARETNRNQTLMETDMKKLALTTLLALSVAVPAVADSVHNETAQKIFEQLAGEKGASGNSD